MNNYLKKGGIAIVDQVLFSGSNFLVNLFLVRLLSTKEYGIFGSLYSLYLLFCISFIAIFLEPYIYYKNTLKFTDSYTTLYARFNNTLLLSSLIFLLWGYLSQEYILIYISYTLTTCVIYFYKRHFLSILAPKYSLLVSANYFFLVSIGLICLNYFITKNLLNAFLVLNLAGLLSILPIVFIMPKFNVFLFRKEDIEDFINIIRKQKKYAFHCFSSGLLSWIPNNIYLLILPIIYSNEINGLFKSLQNLSLPITHLNIAIVSLLVPVFIKSLNPEKLINKISLLFVFIPLSYLVILLLFLGRIQHYIYDNKYTLSPLFVSLLILGIIPEIIANIYKAYYRSIDRPELVTKINFINAIISLLSIYVVFRFGLTGVLICYIIVNIINLSISIFFSPIKFYTLKATVVKL